MARVPIEIPSARAETSAHVRSRPACRLGALFEAVPKDRLAAALADCERIARPASNSHVDLLGDHYSRLRQCMPRFLEVLTFGSHRHDDELLEGIDVLKKLNQTRRRNMPPDAPLTFVPKAWMPFVLSGEDKVSRRFWELALLWRLRDGLRSGDVWVELLVGKIGVQQQPGDLG